MLIASCPPLNNVDYRNVTYTTFFNNGGYGDGTVAYFSCYSYDVTDEASILTCTDGTWTGSSECKGTGG